MKRFFYIIIATLLSASSIEAQSTSGTEFWLTYGKILTINPPLISLLNMQIRIATGNVPASGTIYFADLDASEEFHINAYEVYTYHLNSDQKNAVYNVTTGIITNKSIHITSSEPVSVYTFAGSSGFNDATNVLPVTALDTEYYHCSYTHYAQYNLMDAYAVVATQNNTTLYHNGGSPVTLNAGQVYYKTSTDMTGSLITANNPVAFFALHQGAMIPSEGTDISPLVQQLAPVKTWDNTFFVPATVMEQEMVRIVASKDNTDITTLIGGAIRYGVPGAQTTLTGLQAGQWVELDISNTGCYIETNNPVGVCSYIKGFAFPPSFCSIPSQTWIPGIKQTVSHALIAPFNTVYPEAVAHRALILTPTAKRDDTKVSVGGTPFVALSGGSWTENTTAGMSFYSMPLTNETESYLFYNQQGMIVFGYGIGYHIFICASYYYLAGSAMRDLDAAFYANDIHFQDLPDTAFCAGAVEFRAEIEGELHPDAGHLKWYVDGLEETSAQDHLEWNRYFAAGEYEITMEVHYETGETVSKTGTLQIESCNYSAAFYANDVYYADLADTLFCVKDITVTTTIEGVNAMTSLKWYINDVVIPDLEGEQTWDHFFGANNYVIKMEITFNNGEMQIYEGALSIGSIINIAPITPDGGDTNINGGTPNTGGCFKVGTKIYFNAVPK